LAGRRPRRKFMIGTMSESYGSDRIMDWYTVELARRFGCPNRCHCSWCRNPVGNRQFRHHSVYARYSVRLLRMAMARKRMGVAEPLDIE
jgi:hypothetical protein